MKRDSCTQTEPEEGSRSISVQYGEQGAWAKESRFERTMFSAGRFISGSGQTARARSSRTRRARRADQGCQVTAQDIARAEGQCKRSRAPVTYVWENGLYLALITDENVRDWTPGDSLKMHFNNSQCMEGPF